MVSIELVNPYHSYGIYNKVPFSYIEDLEEGGTMECVVGSDHVKRDEATPDKVWVNGKELSADEFMNAHPWLAKAIVIIQISHTLELIKL